jgi:hypothetical protein
MDITTSPVKNNYREIINLKHYKIMKTILKTTIIFCVIFFAINSYSQVTVTMSNMQYINGTQIGDCGAIDFE